MSWGDSFQALQATTLAGGFLLNNACGGGSSAGVSGAGRSARSVLGSNENSPTVFCKAYQRGTCTHTQDHQGMFLGESRFLKHICAKCWLSTKKLSPHSENSETCPLKEASS